MPITRRYREHVQPAGNLLATCWQPAGNLLAPFVVIGETTAARWQDLCNL
jgi:hypothetical protein